MWIEIYYVDAALTKEESCHVCGMWIEIRRSTTESRWSMPSCHVCGMWIEINYTIFHTCVQGDVMPRMWHVD